MILHGVKMSFSGFDESEDLPDDDVAPVSEEDDDDDWDDDDWDDDDDDDDDWDDDDDEEDDEDEEDWDHVPVIHPDGSGEWTPYSGNF